MNSVETTMRISAAVSSHETLPMFAVSEQLAPRIRALGLERNVHQLANEGWTAIDSDASSDHIDRLRAAVRQAALSQRGGYFGISETSHGASADMLLEKDVAFAAATVHEKLLALVEFMCGSGAVISQVSGSLRFQGAPSMPLHCDQAWMPAPFPEHNAMMTACWYLDDIHEAGAGATMVVPGTHLLRRQPSSDEAMERAGALPILCKQGSIAMWDGRLWHANYARDRPGERTVVHTTYCRSIYRPLEDYGAIGEELIARHGAVMAKLLGRNLWFGNRHYNNGAIDLTKYEETYAGR